MKLVRKFLKLLTVEPVRPLGRWSLDYCTKVVETKVERTNTDHCGPCGQYDHVAKLRKKGNVKAIDSVRKIETQ